MKHLKASRLCDLLGDKQRLSAQSRYRFVRLDTTELGVAEALSTGGIVDLCGANDLQPHNFFRRFIIICSPTFIQTTPTNMKVQRVIDSNIAHRKWLVLDHQDKPVEPVCAYLSYLQSIGKSPNTVRAYAHHLKLF